MPPFYFACFICLSILIQMVYTRDLNVPVQYEIADHILHNYKADLIPRKTPNSTVEVNISMQLYQIIEVNEPQQYVMINAWVIERWTDLMLAWDPADFENISEIMLPHHKLWLPDTTLYNSLTMNQEETKRLMNAQLTAQPGVGANIKLLYPTIYKFSCNLDLRFFPFDVQICTLIFGSWTFDNTYIDYKPRKNYLGTTNFLQNEEWKILGTKAVREEVKYSCCPNNYTLLNYFLHLQRKPLYYVINLIIPTGIITLISIVGFFTSSSINDVRDEKITLGITTLLSMSILILMVSDKMPSTSSFIPLIGWFYTFMIMLISFATLASSSVIYVQKLGLSGNPPKRSTMKWARWLGKLIHMEMPLVMKEAYIIKAREEKMKNGYRKQSMWQKFITKVPSSKNLKSGTQSRASPSHSINDSLLYDTDPMSNSCPPYINLLDNDTTPKKKKSTDSGLAFTVRPPSLRITRIDDIAPLAIPETCEENICEQEQPDFSLPITARSERRNLCQLEFDWLAAVFERMCLFIFLILFFFMCFGINGIGVFYWYQATLDPRFVKTSISDSGH